MAVCARARDDAAMAQARDHWCSCAGWDMTTASCGESLAQIFVRSGRLDPAWLQELTQAASNEVIAWVKRERPDLLPMPNAWQLADLRALALRVPAPPGYTMPAGASETAFKNFERRTGLQLTAQFRAWLAEINGAMIGPGGLFGVREPSDFLSIEKCLRMYPKWRELGWVPVASDGTGNYWVTAPGPGRSDGWVAFIDTHLDPDAFERYAASTVFRFLGFLLESELGNRGWPGNKEYVLARDPGLLSVPEALAPWRRR